MKIFYDDKLSFRSGSLTIPRDKIMELMASETAWHETDGH